MSSKAASKGKKGKKDPKASKKNVKKDPKANKKAQKGGAKGKTNKASAKAGANKGGAKGGKAKNQGKGKKGGAKANGNGKGKKNKGGKQQTEQKEQEYAAPAVKEVNIGPPVILPKTEEFTTNITPMKEFVLQDDDNVEEIAAQFDEFIALLKQRKKDCLVHMRTLIVSDEEDTAPICVDIASMKNMINNIGTKQGEQNYRVRTERTQCLDKIKELMAYEAKHASVTKQRERTSADIIQKEIADGEAVLAEAEPVLERARQSLTKITKSSLDEIRALPKPHPLIVKTIKACAILIGKSQSELDGWPNIKKLLKTTFITNLMEFEARNITVKQRKLIQNDYLATENDNVPDNEKLTFANVNKANSVAGNLVTWLEAQLKYNEFIPKVEPMQARLKELQIELQSIEGIVNKLDTALAALDEKIATSKAEMRENGKTFDAAVKECNAE